MFTITKEFTFSASHQLLGLPSGHQCSRLHGHNYCVKIELAGELDQFGFVVDYGNLRPFGDIIRNELDHRNLNDVVPFQTTAENLAKWLFIRAKELFPQTVAMYVSETNKTWAKYQP